MKRKHSQSRTRYNEVRQKTTAACFQDAHWAKNSDYFQKSGKNFEYMCDKHYSLEDLGLFPYQLIIELGTFVPLRQN